MPVRKLAQYQIDRTKQSRIYIIKNNTLQCNKPLRNSPLAKCFKLTQWFNSILGKDVEYNEYMQSSIQCKSVKI